MKLEWQCVPRKNRRGSYWCAWDLDHGLSLTVSQWKDGKYGVVWSDRRNRRQFAGGFSTLGAARQRAVEIVAGVRSEV